MTARAWLPAALLAAGLGCGGSQSSHQITDAGISRDACASVREEWGAVVLALPSSCASVDDCTVVGGSDNCSGGRYIAPESVAQGFACRGVGVNSAAYAASARANELAATLTAYCLTTVFDCRQADPVCQDGVCVLSTDCKCLCGAHDAGVTD